MKTNFFLDDFCVPKDFLFFGIFLFSLLLNKLLLLLFFIFYALFTSKEKQYDK